MSQDHREAGILEALYTKVDADGVERAEAAMAEIIQERDALLRLVKSAPGFARSDAPDALGFLGEARALVAKIETGPMYVRLECAGPRHCVIPGCQHDPGPEVSDGRS